MNTTTQELSYLSKRPFELGNIPREAGPGDDSLIFGLKRSNRSAHQQEIHKYGYQKAYEMLEEKIGIKLSKQKENQMFQHIFEYENYDELIDIKKDFSIKLFKELSIGSKSLRVDKDVLKIVDKQRQLIKDADRIHSRLIMRPGDIEIFLADSLNLSTSVKQFKIPRKSVSRVIVKGESCFLQTKTPDGFLADDLLTIELATQEDIKNIFELMNKIL